MDGTEIATVTNQSPTLNDTETTLFVRVLEQANKIRLCCFLESKESVTPPAYPTGHKLHSSFSTNIMKRLLLQQQLG
jgi:hypothetical protein